MSTENRLPALAEVVNTIQSASFGDAVKSLLPPGVSQDRFTRTTIVAIQQSPDVLNADRQSLYNAISRAAADGLLPDGKQGALVIFNQKVGNNYVKSVRFMPMVEGIILQLGKAGIPAYAVSVYAKDHIEVWNDDDGQHVIHRPVVFGDRGALVGVFATARIGARSYVETLNVDEIEKIRSSSRSGDGGPWKAWYDRMAQKSVLHRLKKRLPIRDPEVVDSLRDPEEDADIAPVSQNEPETAPVEVQAPPPPVVKRRPKSLDAVVAVAPEAPPIPPVEAYEEDLF